MKFGGVVVFEIYKAGAMGMHLLLEHNAIDDDG